MRKKTQILMVHRGFTLIELLVVIAIISVLSSAVLSSVSLARSQAIDVAVEQNFKNIITQTYLLQDKYNTTSSYTGFCGDPSIVKLFNAANDAAGGGGLCNSSTWAWMIYVPLKNPPPSKTGWCMDSTHEPFASSQPGSCEVICPTDGHRPIQPC